MYTGSSKKQPFHSKHRSGSSHPGLRFWASELSRESAPNLHLEFLEFSEKAMGLPRGFCIQLASIRFPAALARPNGAVAQLGERLICIQEVAGSIPTSSTSVVEPGSAALPARPAFYPLGL